MERDKFNLTFYKCDGSGYFFDPRVKEAEILAGFLNRCVCKSSLEWVEVKELDNHKGLQIETTELSFILTFLTIIGKDCRRNEHYVLGSSRYAFSNSTAQKYYVPDLNCAFRSVSDVVAELAWKAPISTILEIQFSSLEDLIKLIEDGEIHFSRRWSPFDEPNFFKTTDDETNDTRKLHYHELLTKREECKKKYVAQLQNSAREKKNSGSLLPCITCFGADGMSVLIDPASITAVVPETDPDDLITAKIVISNDAVIRVDLRSFVKNFTGFELTDYHLPNFLNEPTLEDTSLDFKGSKRKADEITKAYGAYQHRQMQEINHQECSVNSYDDVCGDDDDDDVFIPDTEEERQ